MYTGETTTKTIYVGTDKYLLALSKNLLTVDALNEKIEQYATINDDGTIADYIPPEEPELPEPPITEEPETQPVVVVDTSPAEKVFPANPADVSEPMTDEAQQSSSSTLLIVVVLVAIAGGILVVGTTMKKGQGKERGG